MILLYIINCHFFNQFNRLYRSFGFVLKERVLDKLLLVLVAFAAGNFIYITASDLIPEIKRRVSFKKSLVHFLAFLLGIFLMLLIKLL
ncbi:MAG: hypothetical protein DRZ76_02400 [Candidatus Nealsonbacteria bacterium]|nr:MAG: hypothetical protein DRZ76_02400 [Candidatus Nealsonbacteria bacterium]